MANEVLRASAGGLSAPPCAQGRAIPPRGYLRQDEMGAGV